MSISITNDERELRKLIKEATGMKVFKSELRPLSGFNTYYSILQEYRDETKPHITVARGGWCAKDGGEYKISIYTPTLIIGGKRKKNTRYIKSIAIKIINALNDKFGQEAWSICNEENSIWLPLSRTSFYLQIPNFE